MRRKNITYLLLGINIIVYLLMIVNGGSENPYVLIDFGAMFKPLILKGQYFRLIMPIFIHIGIVHLLMNSYTLYILGMIFEPLYGSFRFAIIYLLSGILGNLFTFAFGNPVSISAGASTSLYGMFGLSLGFIIFYRDEKVLADFGRSFLFMIFLNLAYTFTSPALSITGHLGGLLGGFLLSGIIPIRNRNFPFKRKLLFSILSVLVFVSLFLIGYTS